jgi:hypothetical protein
MRLEIPASASEILRGYEVPAVAVDVREAQTPRRWPEPLATEAYHGLEIVKAVEPHTEADPVALLLQPLTGFGSIIGRKAHFRAEADRHYLNLFVVC